MIGLIALVLLAGAGLAAVTTSRRSQPASPDRRIAGVFDALRRGGLSAALDTLERAAAEDSIVLRDAHQLAHALGREAVAARNGASPLGACRPIFASGCYHGVVEGLLQSRRHVDMAELERMCVGAGSDARPGAIHECVHGLGHGVLGATGFDLDAALRHCDALSVPARRGSCYSGGFMEAITSAVNGTAPKGESADAGHEAGGDAHHHDAAAGVMPAGGLSIDPGNPYSPCDRFRDPYASACWLFQGFVILRMHQFAPAEALRTCDDAPDGRAGQCYRSVGHQITGLFQRDDAWVIQQCATGRPDLGPHCAGGAALALAAMDWSGRGAAGFCATAPEAWKEACYRSTGQALAALASPADRAALCAGVEPAYAATCGESTGGDGVSRLDR